MGNNEWNTSDVVLSVPGGLAGQLFAVAYAAWIAQELDKTTHIQFWDVGTEIGQFSLGNLLDTPSSRNLGISYSRVAGNWPGGIGGQQSSITAGAIRALKGGATRRIARAAYRGGQEAFRTWREERGQPPRAVRSLVINKSRLRNSGAGEVIEGFPTSYEIVEEAWQLLSRLIRESDRPDFTEDCGLEESVAIHWRLGDYVRNEFHGAVRWSSLATCLKNADGSNLPVKIFSDSPELAREAVGTQLKDRPHVFVSNGIWEDLVEMTRSRIFIGSHSGISVLAAMALRHGRIDSQTWLPNKWFANREAVELLFPARKTFRESSFYYADLVTDGIPI